MALTAGVRRILRWFGLLLSLVSIVFVVEKLLDNASQVSFSLTTETAALAVLLAIGYGAANLLLGNAWMQLLEFLGTRVRLRWGIAVYGISQLAKYVPGNIFHFVGRQAFALDAKLPGLILAKSVAWEIGLLVLSGSLFTPIALSTLFGYPPTIGLLVLGLALVATVFVIRRLFSGNVLKAFVSILAFVAASGFIFFVLVLILGAPTGEFFVQSLVIGSAFIVSWLVGLITPGAPAGAGIREVVLYALLQSYVSESQLLAAIVLGRVVTVFGDVVFYLFALGLMIVSKRQGNFEAQGRD